MSEKRKISFRKVLQLFVTVVVTAACVTAMLSASSIQDRKVIKNVSIHITNENKCKFVDKEQVAELLMHNRHIKAVGVPVSKLDIHHMESIAQANPWIKDAQVFVDNNRDLQIYVTQRVPVVRVFETDGNSYYLDTALKVMPLSETYVDYAFVVTNVPELKEDSLSKDMKAQIIALVMQIKKSKFWNTQTEQIYVNADRTFELIPVLGNHHILLGDTSRLQEKFDNLFTFYQNVLNRIGWDKYEVLDVRFKDQVVASPSLPWKGPKDLALNNMNWVKSIIGTEPKDSTVKEKPAVASAATPKVVPKVVEKKKETRPTSHAAEKKKPIDKKHEKDKHSEHKNEQKAGTKPKYIYQDKKDH